MAWLICYDIKQNSRRSKACRLLKRHSLGYQKSGFEVPAANTTEAEQLKHLLLKLLKPEDSLLILPHSGDGPDWQLGMGNSPSPEHFLIFN